MSQKSFGLLVDLSRCIGCRECVRACMERRGIEKDPFEVKGLSVEAYTAIEERDDFFIRRMCMHCATPSCASACPVSALRKTPAGPVTYDPSLCMGCRYCIQACPFKVPRYEWDKAVPSVKKCDLCADRLARGEQNACAEACPVGATIAGPRDELLAEAHRRLAESPDAYVQRVYGEEEVGGTSVLFISPVSFASLGFPENLGDVPPPQFTKEALERVPAIVAMGGAMLLAIWWITQRREEVARAEAAEALEREENRQALKLAGGESHES
ncbi:MAG: 4Fe-4S dicluster domain-containing protein [Acidobacteriota bacterium]|jgi:formate dehydrogenase iron-sulfur subunit